jgi:dihydrofolate reductase
VQQFNVIAALDQNRGIGKGGRLPWNIPQDLQYFHQVTTGVGSLDTENALIMGRKTWDSLPENRKPLAQRTNIVISRSRARDLPKDVFLALSLEEALMQLERISVQEIFVIGGGEIYQLALIHPDCSRLFLTRIEAEFKCDTFFPEYEHAFELVSSSDTYVYDDIKFSFCEFHRK